MFSCRLDDKYCIAKIAWQHSISSTEISKNVFCDFIFYAYEFRTFSEVHVSERASDSDVTRDVLETG